MIYLVFTGGTIASALNPATGSVEASVPAEEIVRQTPGLAELGPMRVEQWGNRAGNFLGLPDMFGMAQRVREILAEPDVEGAVLVQGTATMAETAFMSDLLLDTPKPLVVTGSMYNQSFPDSDGPRNVLNAARVALSPEARDMGVLVCLNGEIHAARDAMKTHSMRLQTFHSFEHGLLGNADWDRVLFYRRPVRRLHLPAPAVAEPIDVIKLVAGSDSRLIRAALATGARGIVVEALPGSGGVTPGFLDGLGEAVNQVPTIVCTDCPMGRVAPVYGAGAGSRDVLSMGCLSAGDLAASKARIFLSLALSLTEDRDRIRSWLEVLSP